MEHPKNQNMGKVEFIALMAMMFATIAFSIDAMLPVLPDIAADIAPGGTAQAALILTFFVIGMGLGTFFMGPLSDAWGRKPVLYLGLGIYAVGAVLSWAAPSFEMMLAARVLQGLGAAGPRVGKAFVLVSTLRLAARLEQRTRSAGTRRQAPVAGGRPMAPDESLDQPVLQRMKADHHQSTAGSQRSDARGKRPFTLLELGVDGDADCLKGSGRRVDA